MSSPEPSISLEPAADKLRDSAKWMLAVFGAIGAVIATGIQFSDLGKLDEDSQRLALLGLGLAFFGIGFAVYGVSQFLVPRTRTLADLSEAPPGDSVRQFLERAYELLSPFETVSEVHEARKQALADYRVAFLAWQERPDANTAAEVNAMRTRAEPVELVAQRVLNWANYQSLMVRYGQIMRRRVLPGLAIAVIGSVLFALHITDVTGS